MPTRRSPPCFRATPRGTGRLVYLCALRASGAEDLTGWLAITDDHAISEADTVRRAASIVALCETAEEAAGVPDADALLDAVRHAREQAGAVAGARRRAGGLRAPGAGARRGCRGQYASRATPTSTRSAVSLLTLDAAQRTLRPLAERIAASLSGEPGDPGEPLARAVWEVVGRITQAGGPARLADQVGAATGAIEAFASDVVEGYRIPLDEHEETAG